MTIIWVSRSIAGESQPFALDIPDGIEKPADNPTVIDMVNNAIGILNGVPVDEQSVSNVDWPFSSRAAALEYLANH